MLFHFLYQSGFNLGILIVLVYLYNAESPSKESKE